MTIPPRDLHPAVAGAAANMVITYNGSNEPVGVQANETPATVTLTVQRHLPQAGQPRLTRLEQYVKR